MEQKNIDWGKYFVGLTAYVFLTLGNYLLSGAQLNLRLLVGQLFVTFGSYTSSYFMNPRKEDDNDQDSGRLGVDNISRQDTGTRGNSTGNRQVRASWAIKGISNIVSRVTAYGKSMW